jgi:quinol monooxygenase YgiN
MTFMESRIDDFMDLEKSICRDIRRFKGCRHLEILQDIHNRCVFFSYSHWESESDLEDYRRADFFKETWATLCRWFREAPETWTLKIL